MASSRRGAGDTLTPEGGEGNPCAQKAGMRRQRVEGVVRWFEPMRSISVWIGIAILRREGRYVPTAIGILRHGRTYYSVISMALSRRAHRQTARIPLERVIERRRYRRWGRMDGDQIVGVVRQRKSPRESRDLIGCAGGGVDERLVYVGALPGARISSACSRSHQGRPRRTAARTGRTERARRTLFSCARRPQWSRRRGS